MLYSVGTSVNAVDVLYATMPVFLYLNPSILGYLLEPLMDSQEGTQNQNAFAAVDVGEFGRLSRRIPRGTEMRPLGGTYPNATGPTAVSNQGIERQLKLSSSLYLGSQCCSHFLRIGEHDHHEPCVYASFK